MFQVINKLSGGIFLFLKQKMNLSKFKRPRHGLTLRSGRFIIAVSDYSTVSSYNHHFRIFPSDFGNVCFHDIHSHFCGISTMEQIKATIQTHFTQEPPRNNTQNSYLTIADSKTEDMDSLVHGY